MHYMPKQETGSKPTLLHCKNKGRTQHSSSHRKHTPVCWTILQKLWNGRKEGKNWFFSLSTSLLYHLPQIGFYPRSFHAPHLHHILTLLPHFSLCSSPAFLSILPPPLYCCPRYLFTHVHILATPNLNQSSSSYSLLLFSWYLLPLILSVWVFFPIDLQSLPFCALKMLG